MDEQYKILVESVNEEKLKKLTMDLVKIPSPTGDFKEVSEFFTNYMTDLGIQPQNMKKIPKKSLESMTWGRGGVAVYLK